MLRKALNAGKALETTAWILLNLPASYWQADIIVVVGLYAKPSVVPTSGDQQTLKPAQQARQSALTGLEDVEAGLAHPLTADTICLQLLHCFMQGLGICHLRQPSGLAQLRGYL